MARALARSLLLGVGLLQLGHDAVAGGGRVVELDEETFDQALAAEHVLLFFYAPWCGHCQSLHPHFEEAARALAGVDVTLAKVDGTECSDLAAEYGLTGYPTLKWFEGGEASEYGGERSAASITSWVKRHVSSDGPRRLASQQELAALQADHPAVAVGFFAAAEGKGYDAFAAAALDAEAVPLVVATFAPPPSAKPPAVVMYKTFDEAQVVYSGGLSKAELERWVGLESLPSTIEFLPHTVPQIFNSKHRDDDTAPKHLLLFSSSELPSASPPPPPQDLLRLPAKARAERVVCCPRSIHEKAVAALGQAYASYKGDLINVVVVRDHDTISLASGLHSSQDASDIAVCRTSPSRSTQAGAHDHLQTTAVKLSAFRSAFVPGLLDGTSLVTTALTRLRSQHRAVTGFAFPTPWRCAAASSRHSPSPRQISRRCAASTSAPTESSPRRPRSRRAWSMWRIWRCASWTAT
eukprot:COSAG04_NODE_676_length_11250_cov_6.645054_4_plen_466_part_00